MDGKILLFQIPQGEVLTKIRLVSMMENVEMRLVEPKEYGQTIGRIAMLPVAGGNDAGAALAEPMMVLCVRQEKLDGLLVALRKAGIPPICKAVLTPTNAAWTPAQLLAELQRERAEFLKMRK